MNIVSRFLKKLLVEDLPKLFVRPKKIVVDFQKGESVGPSINDPKSGDVQEPNRNFAGELSVTVLDAQKLTYIFYGMNFASFTNFLEDVICSQLKLGTACLEGSHKFLPALQSQAKQILMSF